MFGLTEEQRQLQSAVRAFAEGEIAPHVSDWDEKSEFPHAVVKKLGEMGLLGVIFPEELGGAGMGYVEYVLAVEEFRAWMAAWGLLWRRTIRFARITSCLPETMNRGSGGFRSWRAVSGWDRGV